MSAHMQHDYDDIDELFDLFAVFLSLSIGALNARDADLERGHRDASGL
jgi:hypothetical protein